MIVSTFLPLWKICVKQWLAESRLRDRGLSFRGTQAPTVAKAYGAMSTEEFDAINSRQQWANEQTLPILLDGKLPDRPLTAIDLGCGTGGSTAALASCCPHDSTIVGYEQAPRLVAAARRKNYRLRSGSQATVIFVCQSIAQPLRNAAGMRLPDESVDLVNSSGVVGHHFTRRQVDAVVGEITRILRPGALASLDSGPTLPTADLIAAMESAGFEMIDSRRSCLVDRNRQILFRRAATGGKVGM